MGICATTTSRQSQMNTSTSVRVFYQKKSINELSHINIDRNCIKTQSSMEEISEMEFLNIGFEITSLGQLKPDVKQVLETLGPYPVTLPLDNQQNQHLYSFCQCLDGSIFYGQLRNGIRVGIGRQHWINEGNYLEGTWVDDKAHGPARMIYPNGDIFDGVLVDNKANGFGIFKNKKKEVRGIWVENRLQGNGIEIRKNGIKYEGTFQNGLIEGRGTYSFPDGRKYTGQVHQGQIHGSGLMSWNDLSYYKGEFRFNQLKGFGCYTDVDGLVYTGYFISIYHPDESKLEILYTKEQNIQDCDKLKKFKKNYKIA